MSTVYRHCRMTSVMSAWIHMKWFCAFISIQYVVSAITCEIKSGEIQLQDFPIEFVNLENEAYKMKIVKLTSACLKDINENDNVQHTIELMFDENIKETDFLKSSLGTYELELFENRIMFSYCLPSDQMVTSYREFSSYSTLLELDSDASNSLNFVIHHSKNVDINLEEPNFEVIVTMDSGANTNQPVLKCGESSLQPIFQLNSVIQQNEGISGHAVIKMPDSVDENSVDQFYLHKSSGPQLVREFCRLLGYSEGSKLNSKQKGSGKEKIWIIKATSNKCRQIFAKMFNREQLTSDDQRDIQKCAKLDSQKNLLNIKCSKGNVKKSSLTSQSSCAGGDNCPMGFTKWDKNSDLCFPNRCSCNNGVAASSHYEFMYHICGINSQSDQSEESESDRTRIAHGKLTSAKSWPFHAKIYKDNLSLNPDCGSAILSPQFLLTAAHCLTYSNNDLVTSVVELEAVYALVPTEIYQTETEMISSIQKVKSELLVIHPNYRFNKEDPKKIKHDIGLVQLSEKIIFNDQYRPICIHQESSSFLYDSQATVIGYEGTQELKSADFTIFDPMACEKEEVLQENMASFNQTYAYKICAGSHKADLEMDNSNHGNNELLPATCQGDSGSPLMYQADEILSGKIITRYTLVGLVSAGPATCQDTTENTIFTEVFSYKDWVSKTINDLTRNSRGTYCVSDDRPQCTSCNSAFKLSNEYCVQEFTQSQMDSLYKFFDDTEKFVYKTQF